MANTSGRIQLFQPERLRVVSWNRSERKLFEDAKRRWGDAVAYEQSWLYLCQALRRGGLVCRNERGWCALAIDYIAPGRHALVAPMAADPVTFVPDVLESLATMEFFPELVKHVSANGARALMSTGLFHSPATSRGHALDEYSEDQFPQVIVDLSDEEWSMEQDGDEQNTRWMPQGPRAADFRHQLRRFFRSTSDKRLDHQDTRHTTRGQIRELLDNWMRSIKRRYRSDRPLVRDYDRCFRDPVETAMDYLRKHPEDGRGAVIFVDGVPAAHWGAAEIGRGGFGIYTLLADTSIRGLSHYTLYSALVSLRLMGARYVNLGGSETRTLFHFKSRLGGGSARDTPLLRKVYDLGIERT